MRHFDRYGNSGDASVFVSHPVIHACSGTICCGCMSMPGGHTGSNGSNVGNHYVLTNDPDPDGNEIHRSDR